ncbi:MAG: cysteine--tRNA ligase [Clostridia bacterium]|nr:cysteine--tRNA ligase [Clostridia bacterium]
MSKDCLKVYNTLTGQKEVFTPLNPPVVKMYTCGPTTYNYIHLGNARPLVVFDTVRRYLEYLGYEVTFVQNFTDVDDKIIKRAQEEQISALELSEKYIREYFVDADALNVRRATVHPRVSQNMQDIIDFVAGLVKKGYAYEVEGDVYFAVSKFKEYGKLSKRSLEDMQAGARIDVDERKKHPGDFALWKKAKPGEPSWESPWGAGRPGWHIECSTMSTKFLGKSFDIHAGGLDLIFPHHENEIAQSEALHDAPMAKYWLHNGFITINQEKMSKSLGNFFLLREITEKYAPQIVRFYLLSTHYRGPLDFDDEKLEVAGKGLERLVTAYRLLQETRAQAGEGEPVQTEVWTKFSEEFPSFEQRFREAMNDDFNTALALAVLFDLARALNSLHHALTGKSISVEQKAFLKEVADKFVQLAGILGLELGKKDTKEDSGLVTGLLEILIKVRQEARAHKNYQMADLIRDELKKQGIVLEDTPQGVRWKYI